MNLRRGLFRLWLVLSVVFVLAVTVASYGDVRREFGGGDEDSDSFNQYLVLPVRCEFARGSCRPGALGGARAVTLAKLTGFLPREWAPAPRNWESRMTMREIVTHVRYYARTARSAT